MFPVSPTRSNGSDSTLSQDEYLFGWDPTPGIVSVWASRDGYALVWRREGARVSCTRERFRPWLFATSLADLAYLGSALLPANAPRADTAAFSYYKFDGPEESYAYLITARDGRELERMIVAGALHRLGRKISSLNDLENTYYRVGPVEQYLMLTRRVYFRAMVYDDLHRLQLDL